MILSDKSGKKIIPIASGKGGVGKTLVSANLAIALAETGRKTIVIDLDLGGSNLHTCLGIKNTNLGISHFLSTKGADLRRFMVDTPYENLKFIPGDVLVSGAAETTPAQRSALTAAVAKLSADYIVLDLGAGTGSSILDFFMISNSGLLVTTPQSTSILNVFALLKNIVIKHLLESFVDDKAAMKYLRGLTKEKSPGEFPPVAAVYEGLQQTSRNAGNRARKAIGLIKPKIVVNMANEPEDLAIAVKLRDLAKQSLDLDLECMGLLYYERSVQDSLSELVPHILGREDSTVSLGIRRMAQKIVQSAKFPIMPLDLTYYSDTYELTKIEAESDYQALPAGSNENAGEIDMKELFDVIGAQQKQIEELKGTLRMLTIGKR